LGGVVSWVGEEGGREGVADGFGETPVVVGGAGFGSVAWRNREKEREGEKGRKKGGKKEE